MRKRGVDMIRSHRPNHGANHPKVVSDNPQWYTSKADLLLICFSADVDFHAFTERVEDANSLGLF